MKKIILAVLVTIGSMASLQARPGGSRSFADRAFPGFAGRAVRPAVDFNEHSPAWFWGLSMDMLAYKLKVDPRLDPEGYGYNESGFQLGAGITGGCYIPLAIINEKLSLGGLTHLMITAGHGVGWKLPVYATLKSGRGATAFTDADFSFALGFGAGAQGFYFHPDGNIDYSYTQFSPYFMLELGSAPLIVRFEYASRLHHEDFYEPSYGEFGNSISISCVFYLLRLE